MTKACSVQQHVEVLLAVILASQAANDSESESTRTVGGVNFQLAAKVLAACGNQAVNKPFQQLKTIHYGVS